MIIVEFKKYDMTMDTVKMQDNDRGRIKAIMRKHGYTSYIVYQPREDNNGTRRSQRADAFTHASDDMLPILARSDNDYVRHRALAEISRRKHQ